MGRYQKIANCSTSIPSVIPRSSGGSLLPGLSGTPESVPSLTLVGSWQISTPVSPPWAAQVPRAGNPVHLCTSPWGCSLMCPLNHLDANSTLAYWHSLNFLCPSESLELRILRWEMVTLHNPKRRTLSLQIWTTLCYHWAIWVNYENLDILKHRKMKNLT